MTRTTHWTKFRQTKVDGRVWLVHMAPKAVLAHEGKRYGTLERLGNRDDSKDLESLDILRSRRLIIILLDHAQGKVHGVFGI